MNAQQYEESFLLAEKLITQDPPDFAQAIPLLCEAAEAGHVEAAFQLAGCLIEHHENAQDLAIAVSYLKQAAQAGHPYARYNLLQIEESRGIAIEDLVGAYQELAKEGLAPAQLRLMRLYADNGNDQKAVKWALKAAEQQNPQAQYFLAQYYQYSSSPDLEYSHKLYQQSAAQGFIAAHWQLGLQYKLGQGVAQNPEKAIEHLRIAADYDIVPAQTSLAELLAASNPAEALEWFEKAAEQGDSNAHVALAEIYLLGKNTERDPQKAYQHAKFAADQNDPEGLRLLGDIHRYGLGRAVDADTARQYYQRSADLGNLVAYQKLLSDSALNNQQNYELTKEIALQRQEAERLYKLAFAAHYGLKRQQNYAEALDLYHQSAERGHSKSQTNLGMMYYSGQGVPVDYAQAAKWFEAAAKQRDTMAQYNLACLYYHGMGVEKDINNACFWLQEAIQHGHEQQDVLKELLAQWKQFAQKASAA